MLEIKDIVNVIINREVVSKTVRDLQTIAVLTGENRYTGYRKFTSVTAMLPVKLAPPGIKPSRLLNQIKKKIVSR